MVITGTHFNYFQVCKRKLWLFSKGINMEHTSDIVYDGKLLHETSYPQRTERYEEILISAQLEDVTLHGKIDYFDARNNTVHEIKRSDKVEAAHTRQLKFYIWLLELNGIKDANGLLEYPKLRKTDKVLLENKDREKLKKVVHEIKKLAESDTCPPVIHARICKSCSYFDFCYSSEN